MTNQNIRNCLICMSQLSHSGHWTPTFMEAAFHSSSCSGKGMQSPNGTVSPQAIIFQTTRYMCLVGSFLPKKVPISLWRLMSFHLLPNSSREKFQACTVLQPSLSQIGTEGEFAYMVIAAECVKLQVLFYIPRGNMYMLFSVTTWPLESWQLASCKTLMVCNLTYRFLPFAACILFLRKSSSMLSGSSSHASSVLKNQWVQSRKVSFQMISWSSQVIQEMSSHCIPVALNLTCLSFRQQFCYGDSLFHSQHLSQNTHTHQ